MSGASGTIDLDDTLRALPPAALPLVESVIEAAGSAGVGVYLVGGPVRDLLLGREIRDVDLMLEIGSKDREVLMSEIAERARPRDGRVVAHGRFGTLRIEAADASIDVASTRREHYPRPGALPVVEPGTLDDDLARRDFSVNALALRLDGSCALVETLAVPRGLADLEAKRLRVLHERSFHDDPTRALRAARLAPRLGFSLTRDSRNALNDALRDGAFGAVSGDRLRRELEKCFSDAAYGLDPVAALRLLDAWHVLGALEPGLELPREAVASLRRLGRVVAVPLWRGPRRRPWVAGLALWFAALTPSLRRRALRRLSVRGELAGRIADFDAIQKKKLASLARARGRGAVDALLGDVDEETLHALHAVADPAIRRRIVRWAAEDRGRRSPISGIDVVALGLEGPRVGDVLARVRAAHLDGEVANREEALALAAELARRPASARRSQRGAKRRARPTPKRAAGRGKRAPE